MRAELLVAGIADAHRHCSLTFYDAKVALRHANWTPLRRFVLKLSLRSWDGICHRQRNRGSDVVFRSFYYKLITTLTFVDRDSYATKRPRKVQAWFIARI